MALHYDTKTRKGVSTQLFDSLNVAAKFLSRESLASLELVPHVLNPDFHKIMLHKAGFLQSLSAMNHGDLEEFLEE